MKDKKVQAFFEENEYLNNSQQDRNIAFGLYLTVIFVVVISSRILGIGESWELKFFDYWVRAQPKLKSERLVLVGVTESELENQNFGDATALFDLDGVVRRNYLYSITDREEPVPSFALKVALTYLDSQDIKPEVVRPNQWLRLNQTIFPPLENQEGGYRTLTAYGYQFLPRWQFAMDSYPRVSIAEVLENRVPDDLFKDRIILIGSLAPSLKDNYFTPYSNTRQFFALEIQAAIIDQIIATAMGETQLLRRSFFVVEYLILLFVSSTIAYLIWRQRYSPFNLKLVINFLALSLLPPLSVIGLSYILFINGIWLPITSTLLTSITITLIFPAYILSIKEISYRRLLEDYNLELQKEVELQEKEIVKYQKIIAKEETIAFFARLHQCVYHHLNNHLGTMYTYLGLMKMNMEDISEREHQMSESLKKSLEKQGKNIQVIEDKIELVKMFFQTILGDTNYTTELNLQDTDSLDKIIDTAIFFAKESKFKSLDNIEIEKKYPVQISKKDEVVINTSSLVLLLIHFIDNSIDAIFMRAEREEFHPDYRGIIQIVVEPKEANCLCFQVKDNGIGIPDDVQEKLFKEVFVTTKEDGLGYGLFKCQEMAARNGWELNLESIPNQETTLEVKIPLQR